MNEEPSSRNVSIQDFIDSLPEIGGGLRSRTVELNSSLAQILLDTQSRNRRVKPTLVEKIARDISEGRWQLNAQPLLIDSEAHLGDGQHRCLAVIRSGRSVPVVVTFGISANAFATLDSGLSRSPSDMLFLRGEKATTNLSRALNLVSLYKRGLMKRNRWSVVASNAEREQLLEEHQDIRDSVRRCEPAKPVIAPGVLAFVHWRGHQLAEHAANQFVDAVAIGANLADDSPAFVLRETLLRNKANRKKKLQAPVILAYTIRAFNCFARSETMRKLTWREREGFPEFLSPQQSSEAFCEQTIGGSEGEQVGSQDSESAPVE